jgi:hypothetical protein
MIGVGEYARTADGVVYVIGREGGSVQTIRMDRDEECTYLVEHELTPWLPATGERVWEFDNEESITGTVLNTNDRTSLIKWDDAAEPEVWRNSQLEPVCV